MMSSEQRASTENAAWSLRALAPLFIWPIGDIPFIPDVSEILKSGFKWIIKNVTNAFLEAYTKFFSIGFEQFLFYPNPREIQFLNDLWWTSFKVFAGIVGLSFMYMLLMAMLFPGKDSTDLQVFLERVIKYFVVIFLSRDLIAFFVAFTHTLTGIYYESGFDMTIGAEIALNIVDQVGVFPAAVLSGSMTSILLLAGSGFMMVLLARMLLVYFTYALLPLFMGFKLVKIGPWGVINEMGEKFISTTAKMMLLGVLVSALLWTSMAVGDFSQYDNQGQPSLLAGGEAPADGGTDATFAPSWFNIFQQFVFFVTPLAIVTYLGFQMLMGLLS